MLVADLNEEQRTAVQSKLDAMVAERANGSGTAILTAPLNIGVGTK